MAKPSALILDRDGTLVAMVLNPKGEQDSPRSSAQFEYYPGIETLLAPWVKAGVPIFLATNQPGIAKGHFTLEDLAVAHQQLKQQLEERHIPIAGIYACVHHLVGTVEGDRSLIQNCDCRKPKPGLLFQIERDHGVDLSQAVMIGDSQVDVDAAEAAGISARYLVRSFISDSVPKAQQRIAFPQAPSLRAVLKDFPL